MRLAARFCAIVPGSPENSSDSNSSIFSVRKRKRRRSTLQVAAKRSNKSAGRQSCSAALPLGLMPDAVALQAVDGGRIAFVERDAHARLFQPLGEGEAADAAPDDADVKALVCLTCLQNDGAACAAAADRLSALRCARFCPREPVVRAA
jgi:hypothetical protein